MGAYRAWAVVRIDTVLVFSTPVICVEDDVINKKAKILIGLLAALISSIGSRLEGLGIVSPPPPFFFKEKIKSYLLDLLLE